MAIWMPSACHVLLPEYGWEWKSSVNLDDARVWQEGDEQLATTWQVSVATWVMVKLDQGSVTQDYFLVYDPTSWSFIAYASLAIKL